ncbi:hypothetical protein TDB9533_04473 [Thalassocella blandensis]|nr:hypothetical protein TDB9533_04473 [Thalassocella blandensis]
MDKKFKLVGLGAAISILSSSVFAVPVLNSTDKSTIHVPAGAEATDWFRSSDANELYVAPPSEGESFLSDYAPRNKSFCGDLNLTRAAEQNALTTYILLSDQVNTLLLNYGQIEYMLDENGRPLVNSNQEMFPKLDENGDYVLTEFGQQLADAIKTRDEDQVEMDYRETLMDEAKRIADADLDAKNQARDDFSLCKDDADLFGEDWREMCSAEIDEYRSASATYSTSSAAYNSARSAFIDSEYELNRSQKVLSRLNSEVADTTARIGTYKTMVDAEKIKLRGMYDELAGMYGGEIKMTYRTTWDKTISEFADANPSKTIRRVNVYNPFLTLATSGAYTEGNPGLQDQTGLLWSSLNIANVVVDKEFSDLPDGSAGAPVGLPGWNDTFQGSIGVTLANACAMIEGTEGLTGPALMDKYSENFSEYLDPNVNYTFDVRAQFGWDAEVNKSDVLRVVERIQKKRGFFSSKSKHSIEREFNQLSSFKIEFVADANTEELTAEEKQELTNIIRSRLTIDVLEQVARKIPADQSLPEMVEVDNPGSTELSQKLRATCKFGWGYRCIGGWTLYAIGDIFGTRSSQMSEYLESNDYRAQESVRDTFFVNIDRGITFVNK